MKKLISFFLCLLMLAQILPVFAAATEAKQGMVVILNTIKLISAGMVAPVA